MIKTKLHKLAAMVLVVGLMSLSACGGADSAYDEYAAAYNKVTANGGLDADITSSMSLEGEKLECSGNFKLDTSDTEKTQIYYELKVGDTSVTQFTDGEYLYTEADGIKWKYALTSKPDPEKDTALKGNTEAPAFEASGFLESFSSFLEAGRIQELGLLSPLPKEAVSKTEKNGNVYTLTLNDSLLKTYVDTLMESAVGGEGDDIVKVSDISNFSYTATVEKDVVEDVTYAGTVTITVPASISGGSDESFDLDFTAKVDFNDPGSEITIKLPSTDGYEELA